MSKQREALELALEALEDYQANGAPFFKCDSAVKAIREALAEPDQELEFWPGDVLICKEDDSKVTVVNGNRGSLQLMNGKIAIAWSDTVGGEYTIEQIKEMFYRTEKPEQKPVAVVTSQTGDPAITMSWQHEPALPIGTKLYTTPPARKPLTDEELLSIWRMRDYRGYSFEFARAIEKAHGIGGEE